MGERKTWRVGIKIFIFFCEIAQNKLFSQMEFTVEIEKKWKRYLQSDADVTCRTINLLIWPQFISTLGVCRQHKVHKQALIWVCGSSAPEGGFPLPFGKCHPVCGFSAWLSIYSRGAVFVGLTPANCCFVSASAVTQGMSPPHKHRGLLCKLKKNK